MPEGSSGLLVHEGRSAWVGHTGALPWQQRSDWPEQTVGGQSPELEHCAGADGHNPECRSPVYAHGAQCGAPSALVQLVADAATAVIDPPRAHV